MIRSRWLFALFTALFAPQTVVSGVTAASAEPETICEVMAATQGNMQMGGPAESASSPQAPQERSCDMPADYATCPSQASCATVPNGQIEIAVDADRAASAPARDSVMPRLLSNPPELRPPRA